MKKTAYIILVCTSVLYGCTSDELQKPLKAKEKSKTNSLDSSKTSCAICIENKENWMDSILSFQGFLRKSPEDNNVKSSLINAIEKFRTIKCDNCEEKDIERIAKKCTKVFEIINDPELEIEIENQLVNINN